MRLRTTFTAPKMDCPSEERLIRMALDPVERIDAIAFDLTARTFVVDHRNAPEQLLERLVPLGFGVAVRSSQPIDASAPALSTSAATASEAAPTAAQEATVLKQLLLINAVMFVAEFAIGWLAQSTGLFADSLDMLADALVYSISLYAVARSGSTQFLAARLSGFAQLLLALAALEEVVRRAFVGSAPLSGAMMGMATAALLANLLCVWLLRRHRDGGVHMQASWIFSTNDALANLGVIVAGALVWWRGAAWPDLVIGTLIALLVLRGALHILRLTAAEASS